MDNSNSNKDSIVIIGAGLCGSLLALRLAQRGYKVRLYERRPDMRMIKMSAGRSINLALSDRGIAALATVGITEQILPLLIPMHGRMIHALGYAPRQVSYSGREGEWINSVSRGGLNALLLDEADKMDNIQVFFNHECVAASVHDNKIKFRNGLNNETIEVNGEVVFGTDGANSAYREAVMSQSARLRFDFSQKYLDTGYKELEIPANPDGSHRISKEALHIWPRKGFMMIALPNLDGSFTVTLFMPFEGEDSFAALDSDTKVQAFFKHHFPSATEHMPDLISDYHTNPTSSLVTVKCFPWQFNGCQILLGDAAHAVVPFYGQGMNASFEDVAVLDKVLDELDGDWSKVLPAFEKIRKPNADAIADLAEDNFYEMRDATADPVFMVKRQIELRLEQNYKDYFSKYSMVTFRADLPYKYAMDLGRKQDKLLMKYAALGENIDHHNYDMMMQEITALR